MNSTMTYIITNKVNLAKKTYATAYTVLEGMDESFWAGMDRLLENLWQKLSELLAKYVKAWTKQRLNRVMRVKWVKCPCIARVEKADNCMAKADASGQLLFFPMSFARLLSVSKTSHEMTNRTFRRKSKGDLYLSFKSAKLDKKKLKEPMIPSRQRYTTVYLSKYTQADCMTVSVAKPSLLLYHKGRGRYQDRAVPPVMGIHRYVPRQ